MHCVNCGSELSDGIKYCPSCGSQVKRENDLNIMNNYSNSSTNSSTNTNSNTNINSNNSRQLFSTSDYNNIVNNVSEEQHANQNAGTLPFILGIFSLFLCALNLFLPYVHLFGIILGIIALTLSSKNLKFKVKLNTAGFVLGLLGLLFGIFDIIVGVVYSMSL